VDEHFSLFNFNLIGFSNIFVKLDISKKKYLKKGEECISAMV